MNMGDSLTYVLVIGAGVVLMFVVPLLAVANQADVVTQLATTSTLTEFGDKIVTTGKFTLEQYEKLCSELITTGNSYEVEIIVMHMDENPDIKTTQAEADKVGENLDYIDYDAQNKDKLYKNGEIILKPGDKILLIAKNTNTVISETLIMSALQVTGTEAYKNYAVYTGMALANGKSSNQ